MNTYVTWEQAKLLKEKGFDEYCKNSYFKSGNFLFGDFLWQRNKSAHCL